MNFSHSQDQLDLRDGAREFLKNVCTPERLREIRDADDKNPQMWGEIAELGLLGYLASEANGGLGMDMVGFSLIVEEAGYVALPEPLVDICGVSVPVLNALGMAELCAQVAAGEQRVMPVSALNPYINQVGASDLLLRFEPEQISLHSVAAGQLQAKESIDPLRSIHTVSFSDAGELLSQGEQAVALTKLAEQHGAVCTAATLVGLAASMIDMASAYAMDRHQFGKPIGSFQAVKHHLASALVAVEFARPVVFRAAADIAACRPSSELSAAHAKIAAIDAAINAAEAAIQVHGGMGYTFEVDLHLWMKRVWALSGTWGDRNYHMKKIESAVLHPDYACGPATTF